MHVLKLRSLSGCGPLALAAMLAACATQAPAVESPPTAASETQVAAGPGKIEVKVLSSRYDLVSGGDALVEIKASEGAKASDLRVTLNGRNLVTPLKFDQPTNTLRGIVSPLDIGGNWLQVTGLGGYTVSQPLVNHPATGPILSGPHLTPFECRTKQSGLGEPTDADCSVPTRYDWFYKSTATPAAGANGQPGSPFKPLANPKGPRPADMAMTTTIDGRTVPYIVRVESGTSDRFIYRIAVLDDPATEAFGASEGWNGRLAMTFGGGCGTNYNQGTSAVNGALSDLYLSRGFAYATSSGLANQLHCNGVLQGETAMMLKEHFIEAYGVPKWTVGTGGSGGAIQQLLITEMYPGILDGLQPSLAFPDSALHTADCGLLQNFFAKEGKTWPDDKKAAVTGFYGTTCASWARSFVPITDATNKRGCGLSDESLIYDKKKNPKGARCTVQDLRVNIYGRDPKTGFARKPDDNVGLQYGLGALNDGKITVDEFLLLNDRIGGNDIDGAFIKTRSVADPEALKAIYASGLMNTMGGGLANVPIINYRWYSDSANDIHSRERDLTIRARLEKAYGRSDNQVIWVAGPRGGGQGGQQRATVDLATASLDAMTKWLDAMAADPAPLSTDKVVKHKPAEATDAYWTADGRKVAEKASWDNSTGYNRAWPVHSEPRLIAGQPASNDIMKCQLKPVDMKDYKATFTKAQESKLKKIFKDGVCDWSKPGVGWALIKGTYQRY